MPLGVSVDDVVVLGADDAPDKAMVCFPDTLVMGGVVRSRLGLSGDRDRRLSVPFIFY